MSCTDTTQTVNLFREKILKEKTFIFNFSYFPGVHKALRAHSTLYIDTHEAREQAQYSTLNATPRLLFRSKSPRKQYHPLTEMTNIQVAS